MGLLPLIWILAVSSICKWLERRKLVAMLCDQSWCIILCQISRSSSNSNWLWEVVWGPWSKTLHLSGLRLGSPPPRSVLGMILKDPDFFDTVRKTSSSCPLFMILRKMGGEAERRIASLYWEFFPFTQMKQHSSHTRLRKAAKVSIPEEN